MHSILVNILRANISFCFKKLLTTDPENGFHVCEPLIILYSYGAPDHGDSLKGQEVRIITICSHSVYKAPTSSIIS